MTLYVDSSAILKRYLSEPDSEVAESLLRSDPQLATARHTYIEVRRILFKQLKGSELDTARATFDRDWSTFEVVELGRGVCDRASEIAESTGVRTLDALHLGAALEAGGGQFPVATYDRRQARAARSLGWTVLGV